MMGACMLPDTAESWELHNGGKRRTWQRHALMIMIAAQVMKTLWKILGLH